MPPSGNNRPLIAANWKMHLTPEASVRLVEDLLPRLGDPPPAEVVLLAPFTSLAAVAAALGGAPVSLGAQDLHWESEGPFTGAVSAPMLHAAGCRWVLAGHSELRQAGDTDRVVNSKLQAALAHHLRCILCVGEDREERAAGRTRAVIEAQLGAALESVEAEPAGRIAIAYEPVWAIGTGRTATVDQAAEVHAWIRDHLRGRLAAGDLPILYGGSVTPDNATALLAAPPIDGLLVGGASLRADAFARIVQAAA